MARNPMEDLESAVEENVVVEETETPDTDTDAPVDPDEGVNVIDRMVAAEGETEFTVAQSGNRSYLAFAFGEDLADMTEKFGDDIVFQFAKAQMIVKAQAVTRPFVGKGMSAIEVIKSWIPGVKRAAGPVDKKAAALSYADDASVEELEELLAKLTAVRAAKG